MLKYYQLLFPQKPIDYECAVRRAVREAKCEFAEIPLCFQKPCRCLSVKVDVITDGTVIFDKRRDTDVITDGYLKTV